MPETLDWWHRAQQWVALGPPLMFLTCLPSKPLHGCVFFQSSCSHHFSSFSALFLTKFPGFPAPLTLVGFSLQSGRGGGGGRCFFYSNARLSSSKSSSRSPESFAHGSARAKFAFGARSPGCENLLCLLRDVVRASAGAGLASSVPNPWPQHAKSSVCECN